MGVGSVFFFTIDADTPPNWSKSENIIEESQRGLAVKMSDDIKGENILLLYKDPVSTSLCTDILKRCGCTVISLSRDLEKSDYENLNELKSKFEEFKSEGRTFKCVHIQLGTVDLVQPGNYTCAVVNLFRSFNEHFKANILVYGNIRDKYILQCIPTLSEEKAKESARYILSHLRRDNNAVLYKEVIARSGYRDYSIDLIPTIDPSMYFERFEILDRPGCDARSEASFCSTKDSFGAQSPQRRKPSSDISVFVNVKHSSNEISSLPPTYPDDEAKPHSKRVLVVEDNILNQNLMMRMLKKLNVECDIANNGLEAIEMVVKESTRYPLVFMDLNMPELDGLEATKRIRRYLSDQSLVCPIIIALTGTMV